MAALSRLFTRQAEALRRGEWPAAAGLMAEMRPPVRLPPCAFAALAVLVAAGILLIRATLLENAYDTGTALSRSYAEEERGHLAAYETLLTFGTAALDSRLSSGKDRQAVASFLRLYFQRLDRVLGGDVVDPYVVLEGEILAATPWEGDADYNFRETPWYQQTIEVDGNMAFTHVYTDAIDGR